MPIMPQKKKVPKLQIQPESEVKHKNLPNWILQFYLPSALFLLFSFPCLCLFGVYTLFHHVFHLNIYLTFFLLSLLSLYGGIKIYNLFYFISKVSQSYETGETSILEFPYVHDTNILTLAWNQSPYNPKCLPDYHTHIKDLTEKKDCNDKNDRNILTLIKERICFQPKEGYCGHATVNTVLRSLDSQWLLSESAATSGSISQPMPMAIPYPRFPGPFNVNTLGEYISNAISNSSNSSFDDTNEYTFSNIRIKKINLESTTKLEQFHSLIANANNKNCRLLVNFHRKPLFYSEYTHIPNPTKDSKSKLSWKAIKTINGGHWSPIASVISIPKSQLYQQNNGVDSNNKDTLHKDKNDNNLLEYMVLMLDVNSKYGPFMVPMERLFKAVKTKETNGSYRGMLQFYFDPVEEIKSKNE